MALGATLDRLYDRYPSLLVDRVDEHEPGHAVPPEARARMEAEARRGMLGEDIPLEPDA